MHHQRQLSITNQIINYAADSTPVTVVKELSEACNGFSPGLLDSVLSSQKAKNEQFQVL